MAKKKVSKKKTNKHHTVDKNAIVYMYSLIIIAISFIGALRFGVVGEFLYKGMRYIVGDLSIITFVFIILITIYYMIYKSFQSIPPMYRIGGLAMYLIVATFLATQMETTKVGKPIFDYYIANSSHIFDGTFAAGGGMLGVSFYALLSALFARIGTYIILVTLFIIVCLLMLGTSGRAKVKDMIKDTSDYVDEKKQQRVKERNMQRVDYDQVSASGEDFADLLYDDVDKPPSRFIDVDDVVHKPVTIEIKQPKVEVVPNKSGVYSLPKLQLLQAPTRSLKSSVNVNAANEAGKQLVHILAQFGIQAELVATHIGPSVTKFELRPEMGVRVNRISNLQQDIKMGLAARDIRIEAPIPGKSSVGVEIPNVEKTVVVMRELLQKIPPNLNDSKLLFALGKDLTGNSVFGELNKMPHLLIAGATGSGKSVCVNSIITSILMRATPKEVKLLLIDPKKVEFTQYAAIPHLIGPLITDGEEASRALKVVVTMMDDRYQTFAGVGVRNINGFNQLMEQSGGEKMPWVVVIIDELADLMLVAAKDVEASIQRITQLARAAGIHLVVATQRPSVDVITGVIKANIPSRIAFAVSSAVDSRTILDQHGAEKLLGLGDMLYIPHGENNPIRVQGCFVSDQEVDAVASYCSSMGKPHYEDAFIRLEAVDRNGNTVDVEDPLYEEVKQFVIESQKASTSFIQRKFSIGYARAARLIDYLEGQGIIGPANGSKPREVYVKKEYQDE